MTTCRSIAKSQIFARENIDLDRSNLSDWFGRSSALLEPLVDAIGRLVRQGSAVSTDDTPVKLQAPEKDKNCSHLGLCER